MTTSKVCLIRPPAAQTAQFTTTSPTLPLGLAYIAAALDEAGVPVHVVDAVGEAPTSRTRYCAGYLIGLAFEQIVDRIPGDADIVGISVIFTHEWPAVVRLTQLIRERRPELRIILGGEHVTSMPEFCLFTSEADVLALGEGEETIVELVAAIRNGLDLKAIDGVVFRDGKRVVSNRRRKRRQDIDRVPLPAWHYFHVERYHEHRLVNGTYSPSITIPLLATRGCPYQCTYCSAPNMWLPLWIARDPVKVVDEIEHWVKTYNARHFPFQDLTAIIRKEWIVRFCNEIIARNLDISWELPGGTRSEAIDAEVADLLSRSNMKVMAYAPESGSEATRRFIKKKMHTGKLFESIENAANAGLRVCIFIVLGLPHDTAENLSENLPFADRLAEAGVHDISVAFYMALPGTELFESLYDAGRIKLDRAYFCHMLHQLSLAPSRSYSEHLGRLDLARWKLRIFWRFYAGRPNTGWKRLRDSLRRALRGFGSGEHDSRLETSVRNAVVTFAKTILLRLRKPWMSRRDEHRLFADWDEIYREIRRQKVAGGITFLAPSNTKELHEKNVIVALRREHETPRVLELNLPSSVAGVSVTGHAELG